MNDPDYLASKPNAYFPKPNMNRVGHNRIYTPYMTVCTVISLLEIPYTVYNYMVLAHPKYE
jgi:hypothetical protein